MQLQILKVIVFQSRYALYFITRAFQGRRPSWNSGLVIFVWDIPHFVKAREIYFFIYLSTREKCLSRGFYLRSVSREEWIPVGVFS